MHAAMAPSVETSEAAEVVVAELPEVLKAPGGQPYWYT
jgi:hypothetical protein